MEYTLFKETIEALEKQREKHKACLVGFSGGKDSLVCLDLCTKTFQRVVPFHLYLVPGLRIIQERLKAAEKYGLAVREYPSFLMFRLFKEETYCRPDWKTWEGLKDFSLKEVHDIIRADAGISLIVSGAKESDSLWRRQKYFKFMTDENMHFPLRKWRKVDVLAYLAMHEIDPPKTSRGGSTGIDLSTVSLLWLYDHHPDDFERIEKYFPYVRAVVKRREWYGIE